MSRNQLPLVGLVSAEALSLLGNQVAAVAVPILVLQYTQSPLVAGIAAVGNVVPVILAAFVGGLAIDRYGAWGASILSDALSACSVLALPITFALLVDVPAPLIFLLVLLGALFDPTGVAARQTLVPSLARLAKQPLARINSWRAGLESGADFAGPLLGVGLIGLFGTLNALFVNAVSFALCAAIVAIAVPRRRTRWRGAPADFLQGARFIFGQRALRALAIVGSLGSFVLLPYFGLMLPVLATQKFANPALLGICLSVFGVSAMCGALAFDRLRRVLSLAAIFYGGLLLSGIAIGLSGWVSGQAGVVFCAALGGSLLGAGNPLEQTLVHALTPRAIAGQVFASMAAVRFASGPLGLVLAGACTEFFGAAAVLEFGGALLAATALSGWRAWPLRPERWANESLGHV